MDDTIRFRCREEGDWLCFWAHLGEQFSPALGRSLLERNAELPFFRYALQDKEGLVLRAELLAGEDYASRRIDTLLAVGRREIQSFRGENSAGGGSWSKLPKATRECVQRAKELVFAACEDIGVRCSEKGESSLEIIVTKEQRRYSIQVEMDGKVAWFELKLCEVEALTPDQERALLLWAGRVNEVLRFGGLAWKEGTVRARVCTATKLLTKVECCAAINTLLTMRPLAECCAALLNPDVAAEYIAVTGGPHCAERETKVGKEVEI